MIKFERMESVYKQKIKNAVEKFAKQQTGSGLQDTAREKVMNRTTQGRAMPARGAAPAARQPSRPAPAPSFEEMPGLAVDDGIEQESQEVTTASDLAAVYRIGKDILPNQKFQGRFIQMREVLSPKLKGGKANLIEFETLDGSSQFGVWAVSALTRAFAKALQGDVYTVTYLGKADKPAKEGDDPAHMFKIVVQAQG